MEYRVHLIKDPAHPDARQLLPFVQGPLAATCGSEGAEVFGGFQALLGLATNELYVIASADSGVPDIATETEVAGYQLVETVDLEPTVRPLSHSPLAREGLYVFRWFEVHNQDIDEIVALSETAWKSFESDFEAQVQGLFAHQSPGLARGNGLLQRLVKNDTGVVNLLLQAAHINRLAGHSIEPRASVGHLASLLLEHGLLNIRTSAGIPPRERQVDRFKRRKQVGQKRRHTRCNRPPFLVLVPLISPTVEPRLGVRPLVKDSHHADPHGGA